MRRSVEEPENEKDDFQDAFRRSLHSYRAPVDPQGWSRLEETLNTNSREKRRGFIAWLAAACAGLLLLAGSMIGYLNLQKNNPKIALETVGGEAEKVTYAKQEVTGNSKPAKGNAQDQAIPSEELAFTKPRKDVETFAKANNDLSGEVESSVKTAPITPPTAIAKAFKNSINSGSVSGLVAFEKAGNYAAPEIATETSPGVLGAQTEYPAESAISNVEGIATPETPVIGSQTNEGKIAQSSTRPNAIISSGKSNPERSLVFNKTSEIKSNTRGAVTDKFTLAKTSAPARQSLNEEAGEEKMPVKTSEVSGVETENMATASSITSVKHQLPDTAKEALPKQNTMLAQDETDTKAKNTEADIKNASKWQLALAYAGLNFHQNLQVNGFGDKSGDFTPQAIAGMQSYRFEAEREFNEETRSAYSWQSSVSVGYNLNPHLTVLSGLEFTSYNAQTLTHYFLQKIPTYPMPNVPNPQVIENELPVLQSVLQSPAFPDSVVERAQAGKLIEYQYRYLGLPLNLEYHTAFNSKWNIFVKGGLAINRLIKASFSAEQPNAKSGTQFKAADNPFRNWQTTVNSAAGISYKLDSHWHFKAGMESTVFLQSLTKQNQYLNSGLPYSYGLNTSLAYQF